MNKLLIQTVFLLVPFLTEGMAQNSSEYYHCDVPPEWFNITKGRAFYPGSKWPQGIVKYELHRSLAPSDLQQVQNAMDEIQSKTCIRFQRRSPSDQAYTSIEVDNRFCGIGHLCYTGGAQYAKFGGQCRNMATMVHELAHNLCLGHEHTRKDRDEYLHYDGCQQIPPKENYEVNGYFFDYASQMHYACTACDRGWPRVQGVSKCGPQITPGLSVTDADKINDLYNCPGCLSHRWRPIERMTSTQSQIMFNPPGSSFKICRGMVTGGHVPIGGYNEKTKTCQLPTSLGKEYVRKDRAQVLTIPSRQAWEKYMFVESERASAKNMIAAGRKSDGVTGYVAAAKVSHNGKEETMIGTVWGNDMKRAVIPVGGKEVVVTKFMVLICS